MGFLRRVTAAPDLKPLLCCVGLLWCLAACATKPPASDPDALAEYQETNDPLEPTNRFFYRVNNGLDTIILRPASQAYTAVLPQVVRTHIHDVLNNLGTPVTLANDMMQGKPRRAGNTLMRMVINTTVGVAGIFDVADGWGYHDHDTDFGVTLALWGVPAGPFLFLPLFGPSDPRDGVGIGAGIAMDPLTWVGQGVTVTALNWTRFGVSALDARAAHAQDIDTIRKTALDPYATFRSLYRQHRSGQIEETRNDNTHTIPIWFPQEATRSGSPANTKNPPVGNPGGLLTP